MGLMPDLRGTADLHRTALEIGLLAEAEAAATWGEPRVIHTHSNAGRTTNEAGLVEEVLRALDAPELVRPAEPGGALRCGWWIAMTRPSPATERAVWRAAATSAG